MKSFARRTLPVSAAWLVPIALIAAAAPTTPKKTPAIAKKAPIGNRPGPIAGSTSIRLHSGWKISPVGTRHETMGDLLLGGVVSPDGKWLAFVNGGRADHQVHLADADNGKVVVSLPVERAQSSGGVAFSPDGAKLYVSGANAGQVYVFAVGAPGTLAAQPSLVMPQLQSILLWRQGRGADSLRRFRRPTLGDS